MGFLKMFFGDAKKEDGYFTVEAALILPMALLFIVMMIFLAFYSYDRCVLEQSAYEAAMRGTSNHIKTSNEAYWQVHAAADTLIQGKLFAMQGFSYDVSAAADFVTVNYRCTVNMPLMGWLSEYASGVDLALGIKKSARRSKVTKLIRECRVANNLIK